MASEREIFDRALAIDEARERAEYLRQACGQDEALREHIEGLLQAHAKLGEFLEHPPLADEDPTVDQSVIEGPGAVIGPYKLLQKIGEGGFGLVYMAEQTEPVERRVALKIIKPGMDSRQVISRFEAEEQALAMMDHPNIARVFDAGITDSGRPYFVMELVKGIPITKYCDEQHLTPRQRLELFIPVCHAVQHAHQKGIIHRDLKPSNVLVALYDDKPVPKVIDFGVAKATSQNLTERTMFTQYGQIVGTLEYMSPEQANLSQLDIDTRSDIYSLGVLLYELLTGETPFDGRRLRSAAFHELLRIIREEEPPRPSLRLSTSESLPSIAANRHIEPKRLSTLVRGELDWIVMKALEKDRSRRYETANGLANDIERYLNDEPVVACPPSASYRFRKFARRNKTLLTTIVLVAAALLLGIVGTSWQAVRATAAQRLAASRLVAEQSAREEANRARLAEAKQRSAVERQRDQAEENLRLAHTEQQRAEGNLDLALAALDAIYLKSFGRDKLLAEAVAGSGQPQRLLPQERPPPGESDRRLLKRGLNFYDQFAQKNAAAPHAFVRTAQAYYRVGLIQGALGDAAAAVEAYRGAIERFKRLTEEEPGNAEHFRGLADAYLFLGIQLSQSNTAQEALQNARLAYSDAIRLRPDDPTLYLFRGLALYAMPDAGGGEDFTKVIQLDPQNLEALLLCAKYYRRDLPKARDYAERALAITPQDPRCHIALADVLGEVDFGGLHPRANAVEALEHYDRAIELAPNFHGAYYARGTFHYFNQDHPRALTDLGRALELKPGDDSALLKRARALTELGEYDKALADLTAIAGLKRNAGFVDRALGDIYLKKEDWQAAVDAFTKVVEINPAAWFIFQRRALAHAHLGRYAQSLADLKRALELKPEETNTLGWIPPGLVAGCPDQSFRPGLLELAAIAVEKSPDRMRALRDRATFYLRLGQWEMAKADLAEILQLPGANHDAHYQFALVCLVLNDAPKYRNACSAMVRRFGTTDDPVALNLTAWTCALAPGAVADYEPVMACAAKAVEAQPDADHFATTLGAILYRADRPDAAIPWLTEATRPLQHADVGADSSPAYAWYFLATAYRKIGNDRGAQEALNKVDQSMDQDLADKQDQIPWSRRATVELLRKESEGLLAAPAARPEVPAEGAPRPSNAANPGLTGGHRWVLDFRQARRFAAENNWAEAAAAWSRAIELRPGDGELWKARGAVYEKLDQWDTAIADYRKAIALEPQKWRFWKSQAENLARSGKLDRAAAIGASLVEHNPKSGALWKLMGELLEKSDRWNEAITHYQKAMELEPKQWPAWKTRAEQFAQSNEWEKAIDVYSCLLKVDPADRAIWQGRAAAFAAQKQWDQSIRDYGEVIRLKPEDPSAWRQRGLAHLQLKAYGKAFDDFSQLIKLQPGDAGAWRQRAQASMRLEDYDRAIADLNEALRLDPKSFWGYVGRSEAYRRKIRDLHQAIADCNEAIRLDPKNSWGHAARAEVHLLMGDYDQAIADSSEAIRVIPLSRIAPCCWAYAYRAAAHLAKGDPDQAIADYNEAIRLAPEEALFYALRAEGYLTLDRFDEALADCRKCVELASDQAAAALIHAQILLAAGRTAEYRQACAEMLERFGPSENPAAWCDVVRACVLAPQAVPDPMLLVALAQRALASNPRERNFHALGAAHLRAWQLEEAARRFHESLKAAPAWDARSLNWLGLALVHQARGETQEARQWLAQAADLMDRRPASGEPERLEGRILRHEAEKLLKGRGEKNETTEEDKDR